MLRILYSVLLMYYCLRIVHCLYKHWEMLKLLGRLAGYVITNCGYRGSMTETCCGNNIRGEEELLR
jgi:hypothetical protein